MRGAGWRLASLPLELSVVSIPYLAQFQASLGLFWRCFARGLDRMRLSLNVLYTRERRILPSAAYYRAPHLPGDGCIILSLFHDGFLFLAV
jgi:hypothetical protein